MYLNKKIAIILFAYNRPSHLRRVLIALEDYKIKNPIYLFLDGPKNKKDKIIQKEITFMVKTNKNLNIKFFYYKKNIGIAKSVFRGIDKISSRFKHIIILEDDTIPRKEFFNYTFSIIKKIVMFIFSEIKRSLKKIVIRSKKEMRKKKKPN